MREREDQETRRNLIESEKAMGRQREDQETGRRNLGESEKTKKQTENIIETARRRRGDSQIKRQGEETLEEARRWQGNSEKIKRQAEETRGSENTEIQREGEKTAIRRPVNSSSSAVISLPPPVSLTVAPSSMLTLRAAGITQGRQPHHLLTSLAGVACLVFQ